MIIKTKGVIKNSLTDSTVSIFLMILRQNNLFTALTLIGLIYLPSKLKLWGTIPGTSGMDRDVDDENTQILRQMGNFRRRKTGNPIKNKHV